MLFPVKPPSYELKKKTKGNVLMISHAVFIIEVMYTTYAEAWSSTEQKSCTSFNTDRIPWGLDNLSSVLHTGRQRGSWVYTEMHTEVHLAGTKLVSTGYKDMNPPAIDFTFLNKPLLSVFIVMDKQPGLDCFMCFIIGCRCISWAFCLYCEFIE